MPVWAIVLIVVVAAILILAIIYKNVFVGLSNQVKEAFSTMDVYLKQRWDLVPNLVETVKGYAKHEKETFEDVVKLRSGAYDKMTDAEKIEANQKLTQGISRIMALAENYPELKASDSFNNLSAQLTDLEKDIANSRKYYNATVKTYNNKVEMIPGNLFAAILGYRSKPMFEIADTERANVKVEF